MDEVRSECGVCFLFNSQFLLNLCSIYETKQAKEVSEDAAFSSSSSIFGKQQQQQPLPHTNLCSGLHLFVLPTPSMSESSSHRNSPGMGHPGQALSPRDGYRQMDLGMELAMALTSPWPGPVRGSGHCGSSQLQAHIPASSMRCSSHSLWAQLGPSHFVGILSAKV